VNDAALELEVSNLKRELAESKQAFDTLVAQDITDRRRAVEELRASEQRYRRIVEGTSEGVYIVDRNGRLLFTNGPFAEMLGFARAELIGCDVFSLMDDQARAIAVVKMAERLRGIAGTHEHRFRRKDGGEVWTLVNSNPLCDHQGRFEESIVLITDISARRRSDEARNRLAAIVESSEDAILSEDLQGIVTSWNRKAEQLYGYSAAEIIGQPGSILVPQRVDESKGVLHHETRRRRKDGSSLDVSVTVSSIRNAAGEVVGVSRIVRDLTEQRRTEAALRRTEEQLRQAQKMEALGILVGSIAHDFNNALSVVLAYAYSMIEAFSPGEPLRADAEEIRQAAERAAGLTQQLLAFSRQQVLQPRVLDLEQIILGVEKVLRRIVGEETDVKLLFGEAVNKVCADPGQIEQVLMNLVINARDAMPDGGKLIVELSNLQLEPLEGADQLGLPEGPYVMLAVSDTGVGMDAATRERVFDPFFTTKDKGKGTGLGLSTVFGIVQQSGGNMWVYSELGMGSTFKIYLPATDRPVETIAAPMLATVQGGTETILLVEDEEQVRKASRAILHRSGYKVLEAPNAGEALMIAEQYPAPIHLLLTDLVMPHINGRTLAERLTKARPEIRVLFMSGYTDRSIVHHGMLDVTVHFLQKPVTPTVLNRKVREVLDLGQVGPLAGGGLAAGPTN
jgi:two-component system, cell cycle sensor histidine kinase and response regulator CckA